MLHLIPGKRVRMRRSVTLTLIVAQCALFAGCGESGSLILSP